MNSVLLEMGVPVFTLLSTVYIVVAVLRRARARIVRWALGLPIVGLLAFLVLPRLSSNPDGMDAPLSLLLLITLVTCALAGFALSWSAARAGQPAPALLGLGLALLAGAAFVVCVTFPGFPDRSYASIEAVLASRSTVPVRGERNTIVNQVRIGQTAVALYRLEGRVTAPNDMILPDGVNYGLIFATWRWSIYGPGYRPGGAFAFNGTRRQLVTGDGQTGDVAFAYGSARMGSTVRVTWSDGESDLALISPENPTFLLAHAASHGKLALASRFELLDELGRTIETQTGSPDQLRPKV